jgi:hypothetical protein
MVAGSFDVILPTPCEALFDWRRSLSGGYRRRFSDTVGDTEPTRKIRGRGASRALTYPCRDRQEEERSCIVFQGMERCGVLIDENPFGRHGRSIDGNLLSHDRVRTENRHPVIFPMERQRHVGSISTIGKTAYRPITNSGRRARKKLRTAVPLYQGLPKEAR